ncbi:MAG: hypothetical protein QOF01_1264 [Thermomicrobiales bacterium]|jgi:hypothetical protein|nr:hypothetical protein [Thermomicrobiales bacterium]
MISVARRTQRITKAPRPSARVVNAWRLYALLSLVPIVVFANIVAGPGSERPFDPLKGVDFGAFYGGATLVREGHARQLGDMDAQRAVQHRIQERERTGWTWYNALPHPPVASVLIAPFAWLPLRTAYWLFAALGLVAASIAAWVLARALCPRVPIAAALVLFAFEPIWDVAWWGQLDSFLLLPVAIGTVMLMRGGGHRRDLAAGALLGMLALKPIFVPVPVLALAWGRPRAALGMMATGTALAAASVVVVGTQGIRDYLELSRYYQRFAGSPAIVEWRMYNLRGMAIRLDLGATEHARLMIVLASSLLLAILTVAVAGRALRAGQAPDLAIGAIALGALLTAYHVHVQSLVFLVVPMAAWLGRSLAAQTSSAALLWAIPVIAVHAGAAMLRPEKPSPSPSEAGLETYLTACCLALLLASVLALTIPALTRRLTGSTPRAGATP